ncbi:MAG TPA: DUF4325 domain-containing protein [Spirochaetota bacterium]|nr:DUF4325 domain-containing protein [Spirochaetota bacterium]HPI88074.1 DUF4325 domain-containing protein [Spirochaetota bacterium]HPR46441.1 DUF4325 domain-containing protein [Spirochaetota bacterium]
MIIDIKKISKDIKHSGPDLITRPVGRKIYTRIHEKMKDINEHEVLVLDFEGIQVIDSSFIDELIVKLIVKSWKGDPVYYLKLKNISDIAEINIDSVFKSFSLYNNENIAVITEDICKNNSFYIGSLTEVEKDIIEYLRVNKCISMNDIIAFTGMNNAGIEKIIDDLFRIRLLRIYSGSISSV